MWRTESQRLFNTDMIYLAKRVEKDSDDLIAFVLGNVIDVAIQAVLLVMAMFFPASVGGKWLLIFAATTTLHAAVFVALKKKLFVLSTAVRETESKYFESPSENLFYVLRIKLHSLQQEFATAFNRAFEKFFAAGLSESKIRFRFAYGNANTAKLFTLLIFLLGGSDVLDGTLTVGNFVALNGYFTFAMHGVSYFMKLGQGRQNVPTAYTRITEIKNMPPEVNGTKTFERVNSIEIRGVDFSFGERKILSNFSRRSVVITHYTLSIAVKTAPAVTRRPVTVVSAIDAVKFPDFGREFFLRTIRRNSTQTQARELDPRRAT